MTTGTTKSGFAFSLEDEVLDDYELLESISRVDHGDYSCLTEVVDRLLGEEQREKLKNHVRKENGRVSAAALLDEVTQIFAATNEIKN